MAQRRHPNLVQIGQRRYTRDGATPQQGAATTVFAATSPLLADIGGRAPALSDQAMALTALSTFDWKSSGSGT
jgi:hypothetical protein